jgi:hypothetical protein
LTIVSLVTRQADQLSDQMAKNLIGAVGIKAVQATARGRLASLVSTP